MLEVSLTAGDVVRVLVQTDAQTISTPGTVVGPGTEPGHIVVCCRVEEGRGFRHLTIPVRTGVTHVGGVRPSGAC